MLKVGVLASGRGSNLKAILDACAERRIDAQVTLVLSNKPDAYALEHAAKANIPTAVLEHRQFGSREAFDQAAADQMRAHQVDLVCLAGFMRLLSPVFLNAFSGRVLNIHPALLPSFTGLHAQRQAIEAGVRFTGCTVHFVDEGTDTGPVLMQAVVPVLQNDTEETLSARILEQEHRIYPAAVGLMAQGRVRLQGRRVMVDGARSPLGALVNPE